MESDERHVLPETCVPAHRSELEPGPRPGKVMAVVGGRHAGLRCTVLSLLPVEEERSGKFGIRVCRRKKEEVQIQHCSMKNAHGLTSHHNSQEMSGNWREPVGAKGSFTT
jgi:hypothetical protein